MPRKLSRIATFLIALCGACHNNTGKPASPQPTLSPPSQSTSSQIPNSAPAIDKQSDPLRLTATRTHEGRSSTGTVLLRQPVAPDSGDSPHLKLAGARAWLTLGQQRVAAEDWAAAIACARAGLAELGPEYASRQALDHTDMKLLVAQDQIKEGDFQHAARNMLRQLSIRMDYYRQLHTEAIAE